MTQQEELREINEALYAGQTALSAISEAESHLGSARGLGIWDMLGGGFLSGILKHSQLDKAQMCVEKANNALRNFQRELRDVDMNINYGVNFDGMTKAIDLLLDNFLVDALIQSKIKQTQASLKDSRIQVENAMSRLNEMKSRNNQ